MDVQDDDSGKAVQHCTTTQLKKVGSATAVECLQALYLTREVLYRRCC